MMSQNQPISETNIRTASLLSKVQFANLHKAVSARQIALNKLAKISANANNSPMKSPVLKFKASPMRNMLDKRASEQDLQPKQTRYNEPKVACRTNHRNTPNEGQTPETSFFISPRFQIDKSKLFRSKEKGNLTEYSVDKENRPTSAKKFSYPDSSLMEFRRQSDQSSFLHNRPSSNDSFQLLRRRAANVLEKRPSPLERKFTSPGPEFDVKNEFGKVKKVVILRKVQSRSPEGPYVGRNLSEMLKSPPLLRGLGDKAKRHRISLNEMITIKKMRSTENNGVIKKVLHAPTMSIFDLQEEPIKFNNHLKEWVDMWKDRSLLNTSFAKIYTSFWNSPEGSISVLLEPAKKGTLQDLLDTGLTYPESCLKTIAKNLMSTLQEIHKTTRAAAHWLINPKEIMIDADYNPKLLPGLARHAKFCPEAAELVIRQQRSYNKERSNSSSQLERKVSDSEHLHTEKLHGDENSKYFASDIFDLGHCLLTCALGDLGLFDSSGFYSLNNLKYLMDLIQSFKQTSKKWCCLLHNEKDLRKFQAGLNSTVRLKHSLKCVLENNFIGPKFVAQEQNAIQTDCALTLLELLKCHNRFSDEFVDFLCHCTKIDPNQRHDASKFVSHAFLGDDHSAPGVSITLAELLHSMQKEPREAQQPMSSSQGEELNRIFDAIKLVMLNCDKSFLRQLLRVDNLQNPKSTTHKKLQDLACLLDIPFNDVMAKFKDLVFLD